MDAELKAKWIAALRSGEYPQGRMSLRDGANRHCCLGVLCAVAGRDLDPAYIDDNYDFAETALSKPAADDLIAMNDDGKSFAEIADYIEQKL
jgi:hypothetical protein